MSELQLDLDRSVKMFKYICALLIFSTIFLAVANAQALVCSPLDMQVNKFETICEPNCAPREPANTCFIAPRSLTIGVCPPLCCRDSNRQCVATVRIG